MKTLFSKLKTKDILVHSFIGITLITTAIFYSYKVIAAETLYDDISSAHSIVKTVKNRFAAFFSLKNKEPYKTHVKKLKPVLPKIKALVAKAKARYITTGEEQDRIVLTMLSKINNAIRDIYKTLDRKYKSGMELGKQLTNVINKHISKAKLNELTRMIKQLKRYLAKKEIQALEKVISTIKSFEETIPSSKLVCLARLNKRLKAKGTKTRSTK